MSFLAEASIEVPVPPEEAFDALADHASWPSWMPATFAPVGPSPGTLRAGDRILVKIARSPFASPIHILRVDRPREIAWGGGAPGISAEHRFLFEPSGNGGTRILSVELWTGLLAPILKPIVKRVAERVGAEQLRGIAKAVGR